LDKRLFKPSYNQQERYNLQDALYSTRALVSTKGFVISEQTAYDVYGNPLTWTSGDADADRDIDAGDLAKLQLSMYKSECDPNYNWRCDIDSSGTVNFTDLGASIPPRYSSTPANQQSFFTNPYYFTGRRVDFLDNGSLTLQYNRHRYHDYYTGRWTTHDPLGITPNGRRPNRFATLARCRPQSPKKKPTSIAGFRNASYQLSYYFCPHR